MKKKNIFWNAFYVSLKEQLLVNDKERKKKMKEFVSVERLNKLCLRRRLTSYDRERIRRLNNPICIVSDRIRLNVVGIKKKQKQQHNFQQMFGLTK